MKQQLHAAWDDGAISNNPFFLATNGPQKTIKTKCGKRVPLRHVDGSNIECCDCLDRINHETRANEEIRMYAHLVETLGLDAANREFALRVR